MRLSLCLTISLLSCVLTQAQSTSSNNASDDHAASSTNAGSQNPSGKSVPDSTKVEATYRAVADYPLAAQQDGLQGQVRVKFSISETGDVENAEFVSGDKVFEEAALAAARKWKFNPFIKNGTPVKVATIIPFNFAFSERVKDVNPPADTASAGGVGGGQPVQISQGVAQGLVLHKVFPVYPVSARQNHIEGTVLMAATIDKDGRVIELKPLSGPKDLVPAAMGAVQQWRYKPYVLEGRAVQVQTQIVVNFTLSP
jgi:TonB family protein